MFAETSSKMNNDEERNLLEDINALECALLDKRPQNDIEDIVPLKKPTSLAPKTETRYIEIDKVEKYQYENGRSEADYEEFDQTQRLVIADAPEDEYSKLERILELNKELINIAFKARERMVEILDECNMKQKYLQEQISRHQNPWHTNKTNFNASMPYFKDKESFPAPRNADTEAKIKNYELRLVQLQRVSRWSKLDKTNLLKAIIAEVSQVTGANLTPANSINKANQLTKVAKNAIQCMKNKEFDWMKIANNDFENKHSSTECQVIMI